jgi:hypothetical protein
VGICEQHPAGRKSVEVRRDSLLVAQAPDPIVPVIDCDKENVRPRLGGDEWSRYKCCGQSQDG